MAVAPGLFAPSELVVALVALGGIVPVIAYWQRLAWWLVLPYGFLFVGAVATNLEHLFLPGPLNLVEHGVGNMGAGIAVAVTAYLGRRQRAESPEASAEDRAPW